MARQLDGIAKRMAACEKRLREALTQRWAVSGRVEHTLQGCEHGTAPSSLIARCMRQPQPRVNHVVPYLISVA